MWQCELRERGSDRVELVCPPRAERFRLMNAPIGRNTVRYAIQFAVYAGSAAGEMQESEWFAAPCVLLLLLFFGRKIFRHYGVADERVALGDFKRCARKVGYPSGL